MTRFSQPSKLDLLAFIKSTGLFAELDDEALAELADEIVQVGYEYATQKIEEWKQDKSFKW